MIQAPGTMDSRRSANQDVTLTLLEFQPGEMPKQWTFRKETTIQIGRARDNDIRLCQPQVSRFHVTLFRQGDRWECANLGSNGMYISGKRVPHTGLQDGTVIQLSPLGPRLLFEIGSWSSMPRSITGKASPAADKPITFWLKKLRAGEDSAAENLWDCYFDLVLELARHRLRQVSRRVSDEEDVAVNVFNSLFHGIAQGGFPELSHRAPLWRLLVAMTARQAADQVRREYRQKRGGGDVRGDSVMLADDRLGRVPSGFDRLAGKEPTPEFAALTAEEVDRLLNLLQNPTLQSIANWRMDGDSNQEIAEKLGCSVRTIERKLHVIREIWLQASLDDTPTVN